MKTCIPKQESVWPGFFAVVIPIFLIFAIIFMYFSFSKQIREIRAYEESLTESLYDYIITVENRLNAAREQFELIETIAPVYERRVSAIEDWRDNRCHVYCG